MISHTILNLGSSYEVLANQRIKLIKKLMSESAKSAFLNEMRRLATDTCASTKLSTSSSLIPFAGDVEANGSVRFVLLHMCCFASASFGKFLPPNVPVICESADRTQATISTACTAWLSSVGAAVGLPTSGIFVSSVGCWYSKLVSN